MGRFGACVVLLAGMAGCANLWGFKSVTSEDVGDAGNASADTTPLDATDDETGSAADGHTPKQPGDGEPYAPTGDDEGAALPGPEASVDASRGTGDHDGAESDAPSTDGTYAGDAQSPPCRDTCAGCCDTSGQCQDGRMIPVCGGVGLACADCSSWKCPALYGPCCGGANGCGCALLSLGIVQCQ